MDRNINSVAEGAVPMVALRKESVDRNKNPAMPSVAVTVALRKESVDRNMGGETLYMDTRIVALRKESVDRNNGCFPLVMGRIPSLSARRAWIEICPTCQWRRSVKSLSARRAWIEIPH